MASPTMFARRVCTVQPNPAQVAAANPSRLERLPIRTIIGRLWNGRWTDKRRSCLEGCAMLTALAFTGLNGALHWVAGR